MAIHHDIAARLVGAAAALAARRAGPGVELLVADTEAGPVALRLFRPPPDAGEPGAYLHFHAGGFVARARDDAFCRAVAAQAGCVVLAPDYALAPAARFPAAPRQAQALAWWAALTGRRQGWNGKRLAIGGRGAGANLALGACLELPARMAFRPRAAVALAPWLDLAAPGPQPLGARIARAAYLPDRAARAAPLASPLRAPGLKGFAPTLLAVAETDPRRGEAELFAAMIADAGGQAQLRLLPGPELPPGPVAAFLRAALADTAQA